MHAQKHTGEHTQNSHGKESGRYARHENPPWSNFTLKPDFLDGNILPSSLPGLSGQPILFSKKMDRSHEAGDDEVGCASDLTAWITP
jgi:hypothetical protein